MVQDAFYRQTQSALWLSTIEWLKHYRIFRLVD